MLRNLNRLCQQLSSKRKRKLNKLIPGIVLEDIERPYWTDFTFLEDIMWFKASFTTNVSRCKKKKTVGNLENYNFDDFDNFDNFDLEQIDTLTETDQPGEPYVPELLPESNSVEEGVSDRLTGAFVSGNVFNLSKRILSESEISVLGKGLKFSSYSQRT